MNMKEPIAIAYATPPLIAAYKTTGTGASGNQFATLFGHATYLAGAYLADPHTVSTAQKQLFQLAQHILASPNSDDKTLHIIQTCLEKTSYGNNLANMLKRSNSPQSPSPAPPLQIILKQSAATLQRFSWKSSVVVREFLP